MNNRQRALAVLNYENYDKMPVVHFGFWRETIEKWHKEGYITSNDAQKVYDNSDNEIKLIKRLGFDFNWGSTFGANYSVFPAFKKKVVETLPNGHRKVRDAVGVTVLQSDDAVSIPAEFDHLLKDRGSFEKHYRHRLKFSPDRINFQKLEEIKNAPERTEPLGLFCGSLFGRIRDIVGVVNLSYLYVDDPELYDELIHIMGALCYDTVNAILKTGVKFDFGHFWEDICFKNGPLVSPAVFSEKVGPYYKKICDLLKTHGINIVSLDCDGNIDALIPTWLENGVNTMFPIEVGTWNASIEPWRAKYGKELRGVGGMNKNVLSMDYKAIDNEIERLKRLVALGGFIPCPDHRIAPDAIFENVQYYCDKMQNLKV